MVSLRTSLLVLCGFNVIALAVSNQPKTGTGSECPSPTPSLWVRLDDEEFRKPFAAEQLKPVLRDPDSLVIESFGSCDSRDLARLSKKLGKKLCFQVQYRAKNGFGGYNRTSAWIVYDGNGGWEVVK